MTTYLRRHILLTLSLMSTPLTAAADAATSVSASDPHARAMAPGQSSSAAFMTLRNAGDANHAVVSAESSAARIVELHTHEMKDGMMQMRQVERIDVPAGGETVLRPGGLHVMLMGVTQTLNAGDEITIKMVFEDGSHKEIQTPVRKIKTQMKRHMH